jgi:hypothetical protein
LFPPTDPIFLFYPRTGVINAFVLNEYAGTLALALLYILAMFGWGSLFESLFPTHLKSFWNEFASRLISGCGLMYACFIGLSVPGWLHRFQVGVILGIGALAACAFIFDFIRSAATRESRERWNPTDYLLAAFIAVLVALQLTVALTPLIFYDLAAYHFLAPSEFLRTGSLTHIPWNLQTNSPLAIQLTIGMSLALDGSGQLAKLLFAALGCLIGAGTYELIRPAGRRAALLATLFVLCYPQFWIMQSLGVVDLSIAAFLIFGAVWLRQALQDHAWQPAIYSGISFGIALGSRYQAVILTSLIVATILVEHLFRAQRLLPSRRVIQQLILVGLLVTVFVCPWIIRNNVHVGNPVYPFMQGIFGGSEWSMAQDSRLRTEALGPQLKDLPAAQAILSPVMLLFASPSNRLLGTIILLGALIALASPSREIRITAILGLVGLIFWGLIRPTAGVPLLRYNLATLALLLAAAGAVLGSGKIPAKAGVTIAAVLSCGSFMLSMVQLQRFMPVAQALTEPQTWEALREANVPAWAAMEYANQHLDPVRDKILVIGETRAFWLHIPFVAPSAFNGPQLDEIFGGNSEPSAWKQKVEHLGITHLLISYPEFQRLHMNYGYLNLDTDHMDAFNHWLQGLPLAFEDGHGTAILALKNSSDISRQPISR